MHVFSTRVSFVSGRTRSGFWNVFQIPSAENGKGYYHCVSLHPESRQTRGDLPGLRNRNRRLENRHSLCLSLANALTRLEAHSDGEPDGLLMGAEDECRSRAYVISALASSYTLATCPCPWLSPEGFATMSRPGS